MDFIGCLIALGLIGIGITLIMYGIGFLMAIFFGIGALFIWIAGKIKKLFS